VLAEAQVKGDGSQYVVDLAKVEIPPFGHGRNISQLELTRQWSSFLRVWKQPGGAQRLGRSPGRTLQFERLERRVLLGY
jgi:hypothetical protein